MTSFLLESDRRNLLRDLADDSDRISRHIGLMLLAIVLCGGIYGAVLGSWHGLRLSSYVAAKIPVLLITTAVLTSFFNFVAAALFGVAFRYRQVFAMTLLPLSIAAVIAASVTPAIWLFTVSLPPPTAGARTLHNLLYLVHVGVVGSAGYAGTSFLRKSLEEIAPSAAVATKVRFTWIALYAFVGGEVAWILRPFVGSVYLPVEFIRDDALRGNVYEFIVTDIVPHLLSRLIAD